MAPLIDVVFLLLVFFLLTSTFVTPEGLEVSLPGSATAAPTDIPALVVVLAADGSVVVDGRPTTIAGVTRAIGAALERDPDRTVAVRADAKAEVQALVAVVDGLRAAGVHELDIATEPRAPGEPDGSRARR